MQFLGTFFFICGRKIYWQFRNERAKYLISLSVVTPTSEKKYMAIFKSPFTVGLDSLVVF